MTQLLVTMMPLSVLCFLFAFLTGACVHSIPYQANSSSSVSSVPGPPHFVVYSDRYVAGLTGPPPASQIRGFNVFAISFLLLEGAWDKAQEWASLSASERSAVKAQYQAAGIKLIVSVFGATDVPTTTRADPVATADSVAAWVVQYGLDGVDVDYEDFAAMDAGDGKAEAWLVSFTRRLRVHLPQGTYILTHAPVAPWFTPNKYGGGAYRTVHAQVGSLIDWYNVQYYNQGATEYTTCNNLLWQSSSTWPGTSLFEIAYSGIPWEKLVLGKPANAGSASSGYMSTATLASCVQQARDVGWNGGVMVWQFPDAASSWIQAVRGSAFPM